MKTFFLKKFILLVSILAISFLGSAQAESVTLDSVTQAFCRLPFNRDNTSGYANGFDNLNIPKHQQIGTIQNAVGRWMQVRSQGMQQESLWASSNQNMTKPQASFFNPQQKLMQFQPFVQKIVTNGDNLFVLRGDLHGDIHSLMAQLNSLKKDGLIDNDFKLKSGVNMIFLGDYVDRGKYGIEVLYTLARLGASNPKQVHCVRGNHEDIDLSARYGFQHELTSKFGKDSGEKLHSWLGRMYDYMPVAIYLGDKKHNFIQLCHGGLEQGYDPKELLQSDTKDYQLIGLLHRKKAMLDMVHNSSVGLRVKNAMAQLAHYFKDDLLLSRPSDGLGFMWNDFDPTGQAEPVSYKEGRGLEYGQQGVNAVLNHQGGDAAKIMGVIRAHQHVADPRDCMMRNLVKGEGIYNIRGHNHDHCICAESTDTNKDVITMNVAPDSIYGEKVGFDYDTGIEIKLAKDGVWDIQKKHYYPFKNSINKNDTVTSNDNSVIPIKKTDGYMKIIQSKAAIIVLGIVVGGAALYYAYQKYKGLWQKEAEDVLKNEE